MSSTGKNKKQRGSAAVLPSSTQQTRNRSPLNQAKDSVKTSLLSLFPRVQDVVRDPIMRFLDDMHVLETKKKALSKFDNASFVPTSCRVQFKLFPSKLVKQHGSADLVKMETATATAIDNCQKELRKQCVALANLEKELLENYMLESLIQFVVQLAPIMMIVYGCNNNNQALHRAFISAGLSILSPDNTNAKLEEIQSSIEKFLPRHLLERKDAVARSAAAHSDDEPSAAATAAETETDPRDTTVDLSEFGPNDVIPVDDTDSKPAAVDNPYHKSKLKPPPASLPTRETVTDAAHNQPESEYKPLRFIDPTDDAHLYDLQASDLTATGKFTKFCQTFLTDPMQVYIEANKKTQMFRRIDEMITRSKTEASTAATADALEALPPVDNERLRDAFHRFADERAQAATTVKKPKTKKTPKRNSTSPKSRRGSTTSSSPKGRRGATPSPTRTSLKTTPGKDKEPVRRSARTKPTQDKTKPEQSTSTKAHNRTPVQNNNVGSEGKPKAKKPKTSSSNKKKTVFASGRQRK